MSCKNLTTVPNLIGTQDLENANLRSPQQQNMTCEPSVLEYDKFDKLLVQSIRRESYRYYELRR